MTTCGYGYGREGGISMELLAMQIVKLLVLFGMASAKQFITIPTAALLHIIATTQPLDLSLLHLCKNLGEKVKVKVKTCLY